MTAPYRVEELAPRHDRHGFECGVESLDGYLRERAGQDVRRHVSRCYVACPADAAEVAGYYTLAAAELLVDALPETMSHKLPRYPTVPAIRIGRLAVDRRHRSRGMGSALMADAMSRTLRSGIGVFALVVDAKDDAASAFYRRLGFATVGSDRTLVLPLATVRTTLP